jgi:3-phenylpropionate/trans-cinnamate dioxygenase ferredoxin reductase subunit
MSHFHDVLVNDETCTIRNGELLLDSALIAGIAMPYECRSGRCGACHVRILSGHLMGGETEAPGIVKACQSRVFSAAAVAFDAGPEPSTIAARLASIRWPAPDVAELVIEPRQPLAHLPGQYFELGFKGFPSRAFSAAPPLEGGIPSGDICFEVKRYRGGVVSGEIGNAIKVGHAVRLNGPHGSAFLRRKGVRRLVLISGGTGFAPIWSIANAALEENPERPILAIIAAARSAGLYMWPALGWLRNHRNVEVLAFAREPGGEAYGIRTGGPAQCLGLISGGDIVHAAGPPALVARVARAAAAAGAELHADPFLPGASPQPGMLDRFLRRPIPHAAKRPPSLRQPAGAAEPARASSSLTERLEARSRERQSVAEVDAEGATEKEMGI